ncbi:MAG TPA: ABC transporter ATP-binding protein, partial [Rhodocyclaceae bacterium]|nr:ABC transporter ATP-binding protein [Rhodocyclaceae bacterium]
MKAATSEERFTFLDLPRAIWFFLAEERYEYLLFIGVLIVVLSYTMVPPYLIGLIANFLIDYVKHTGAKPSPAPLFWLIGVLTLSQAAVALVRLSSKRVLGKLSLNARYRAKVWGFERL